MNFSFSVGNSEKHTVRFQYNQGLSNIVSIEVDGKEVKKDIFRVWIPADRRYEFQVGNSERHDVTIESKFPRLWAAIKNLSCEVIIDGVRPGQY